jgi:hypothetical protein
MGHTGGNSAYVVNIGKAHLYSTVGFPVSFVHMQPWRMCSSWVYTHRIRDHAGPGSSHQMNLDIDRIEFNRCIRELRHDLVTLFPVNAAGLYLLTHGRRLQL